MGNTETTNNKNKAFWIFQNMKESVDCLPERLRGTCWKMIIDYAFGDDNVIKNCKNKQCQCVFNIIKPLIRLRGIAGSQNGKSNNPAGLPKSTEPNIAPNIALNPTYNSPKPLITKTKTKTLTNTLTNTDTNTLTNNLPQVVEKKEKERKEESDFDFFNCGGGGGSPSQEQAPQKKDIAAAISKIANALTRNPDLICISNDKVIYPQPFKSWIEKQKEFDKITKWLMDKHPGENVSHQLPLSVIAKMRKISKYVMELAYEDYCVTHSNLT